MSKPRRLPLATGVIVVALTVGGCADDTMGDMPGMDHGAPSAPTERVDASSA